MKKSVLRLLLGVAFLFLAVPAFATNWVLIGDGHYIDSDSIKPANEYGTYTMQTEYLSKNNVPLEIINGKEIYNIKTNSFIDCRNHFAKTVSYSAYDANKKHVVTGTGVAKHWYDIHNPGSRAYESFAFVCTDRYLRQYRNYHPLWMY